jgi:hypothetical protein
MAGVVARLRFGPETFVAGEALTGGDLVKAGAGGTAGKVIKCTGVNDEWIGIALYDAAPAASVEDTVNGMPRLNTAPLPDAVAVAWTGIFKVKASEALNFGDRVYPSATAGAVQKTTATGRAVGQVVATGGIASGQYGLIRLF